MQNVCGKNNWDVKIRLMRIWTHDLCDTGTVHQLSYQVSWELATFWVRNTPVEGEQYKWIYDSSYIWTAENDMKIQSIVAVMHTSIFQALISQLLYKDVRAQKFPRTDFFKTLIAGRKW